MIQAEKNTAEKIGCTYYIERNAENGNLSLFLLAPLSEGQQIAFTEGVVSAKTHNIVAENSTGAAALELTLGRSRYSVARFDFPNQAGTLQEIIIHTYTPRDKYLVAERTTVLIEEAEIPAGYTTGVIAYDKPYVNVRRQQFLTDTNREKGLTFLPRVIIPLKNYRYACDTDLLDPNPYSNAENPYTLVVPLVDNSDHAEVDILKLNAKEYYDDMRTDGSFEVIVSYLEDLSSLRTLKEEEDFATLRSKVLLHGTEARAAVINIGAEPITNKPKSRHAEILTGSGLFIDSPGFA